MARPIGTDKATLRIAACEMDTGSVAELMDLPEDLLGDLFDACDAGTLLRVMACSQTLCRLARSEALWEVRLRELWNDKFDPARGRRRWWMSQLRRRSGAKKYSPESCWAAAAARDQARSRPPPCGMKALSCRLMGCAKIRHSRSLPWAFLPHPNQEKARCAFQ